jgi:hypothetical protein
MDKHEQSLTKTAFLAGNEPSKADVIAFRAMDGKHPAAATHPRLFAWYSLID